MKKEVLGVDISKLTIDVHLYINQTYQQFENNQKGFKKLLKWLKKEEIKTDELLICFEHTGMYSYPLSVFLTEQGIDYVMESAIQIVKSMGVVRGKSDRIDAARIAEYAFMRRDKLTPTKLQSKDLIKLQKLLSLRETLVKHKTSYKVLIKENSRVLKKSDHKCFFEVQQKVLNNLEKQIKQIEIEIKQVIRDNEQFSDIYKLITSIKGVGLIIGAHFITTTDCFTRFTDGRKYACYCGVAPFEYSSGTSLNLRKRVNPMANKNMKSLLNLAARSAITSDPELREFYQRKVLEGKNKMSVLNVVRNKIIHRAFAVVKRGTPYVVLQKHLN